MEIGSVTRLIPISIGSDDDPHPPGQAGGSERSDLGHQQDLRPPAERVVRRGVGPRGDVQGAAGPHRGRTPARSLAHRGRTGLRPGRRLLAPAGPAVEGEDPRRGAAVPVPRAALQPGRTVHVDAGPADGEPERHRALVPGRRAAPVPLGLAGRLRPRRPRPGPGHAPDGLARVGRGRRDDPGRLQLPARAGQPDGPHPRGVRALLEHRAGRAVGVRVRGDPRRHGT